MLIGLTGYAGSGKSLVADILTQEHGFQQVAFADELKRVLEEIDPYIEEAGARLNTLLFTHHWGEVKQFKEVRALLQNLGTAIRDRDPYFWVNAAELDLWLGAEGTVVTDVRMPVEVEEIELSGGTVVRITRPGTGGDTHATEVALDDREFPTIVNDSNIFDLKAKVARLVTDLKRGEMP